MKRLILSGVILCTTGCASFERFADDHPAVVVGTGLALTAGAAIAVSYELSKHNRVGVVQYQKPPAAPGCTNPALCER
jgi:hypothetical protein